MESNDFGPSERTHPIKNAAVLVYFPLFRFVPSPLSLVIVWLLALG